VALFAIKDGLNRETYNSLRSSRKLCGKHKLGRKVSQPGIAVNLPDQKSTPKSPNFRRLPSHTVKEILTVHSGNALRMKVGRLAEESRRNVEDEAQDHLNSVEKAD